MKTLAHWKFCLMALCLGAFPSSFASAGQTERVRPVDDSLVLAIVSPGQNGELARMALANDPENLELAISFAWAAIEEGRAQANPRRYGEAQAALQPWWNAAKPPLEVRVLRAVVLQAFHDFKGALGDLDTILQEDPRNGQARLSRAFVRLVTGDIEGATEDCRALPRPVGPAAALACLSRVAVMRGAGQQAFDKLSRLINAGPIIDSSMRRFMVAIAADTAVGLGFHNEADRYFAMAVREPLPEVPLLAAYADFLIDTGRAQDALTLLDGKGEADILLLRRAIAAKNLGDPRLDGWAAVLDERFAAAAVGGVRVHLREEAMYRLEIKGDAAGALQLALENWQVQKEIADARILLASAIAAGDGKAASGVLAFLNHHGTQDSRLRPLIAQLEAKS